MLPRVGQLWKLKQTYIIHPNHTIPFIITKVENDNNGAVVCWFQRLDSEFINKTFGTQIITMCELLSG